MPTPLGERIREQRQKNGLTLEKLASAVESSKSYIWELENKDVARPSAEKLRLIAIALGTTVDYLLTAEDVSEEDATDKEFYRKYRGMGTKTKERIRRMVELLDDDVE